MGVVVAFFFALVFGYYTRKGSGINQRPYRRPDAPSESPSELAHDTIRGVRDWQRGTEGHHRSPERAVAQPPDPVTQALDEWRTKSVTTRTLDPPIGSADHVRGPEDAPTVAVYLDVSSEPCRSAYQLLCGFADARRIRLAVRQLPLADVRRLSLPAAEALEAAAAQGKFFELLDNFANSRIRDEIQLLERATGCVADPERLRLEVSAGRYRAPVIEQIHHATSSGAYATPEIYINGSRYDGPIRRDDLDRTLRRLSESA